MSAIVFEEPTATEIGAVVRLRQTIRFGGRVVTIGGTLENAGERARDAALEVMREQERYLRECPPRSRRSSAIGSPAVPPFATEVTPT